jgi:hypothetical protein
MENCRVFDIPRIIVWDVTFVTGRVVAIHTPVCSAHIICGFTPSCPVLNICQNNPGGMLRLDTLLDSYIIQADIFITEEMVINLDTRWLQ